jgi:hypothetical protein
LPLFWQHRPDQRIGWIEQASEDARGLRVVAALDNPAAMARAGKARRFMSIAVTDSSFRSGPPGALGRSSAVPRRSCRPPHPR